MCKVYHIVSGYDLLNHKPKLLLLFSKVIQSVKEVCFKLYLIGIYVYSVK